MSCKAIEMMKCLCVSFDVQVADLDPSGQTEELKGQPRDSWYTGQSDQMLKK